MYGLRDDAGPQTLWRGQVKKLLTILALLATFSLVAAACGSDDDTTTTDDTTAPADDAADEEEEEAVDEEEAMDEEEEAVEENDALGDGSLGTVTVEPDAEVQIRSLNAITGEVAFLGLPNQRGIEQAVADYGTIKGFALTSGAGLDDLCSADGGQAAAQQIVADEQIVGVIGTSCSGAAAAASPLISDNGLVMISGSNTSPTLTSDTAGTVSENFQEGYYRTAHNDVFQGAAMADYAFNVLGLTSAAAIHDGDPYTFGLSDAFGKSFEELGGTFTAIEAIAKGDTDMVPVLTSIAAGSPEGLFAPLFQPESDFLFEQVRNVSGLEDVTLLSADASLNTDFLALEQSEGIHFSGPDTRFGENLNESTGKTAAEVLATYEENNGEAPTAPFWGHSYDATAMLLDAIDAASFVDADGNLVIDRAGVREYLYGLSGYSGLIGEIACDEFGDCGSQKITIAQNVDPSLNPTPADLEVVFEYVGG
jgi:branched-chain amino acid transport system substrate-binding protein